MVKVKNGLQTYNDAVLVWGRLAERAKAMGEDVSTAEDAYKPADVDNNQIRLDDLLLSIINFISKFR